MSDIRETFEFKGLKFAGPDGALAKHEKCGKDAKIKFLPMLSENAFLEITCACGFSRTIVMDQADKTKFLMAISMSQDHTIKTGFSEESMTTFLFTHKKS